MEVMGQGSGITGLDVAAGRLLVATPELLDPHFRHSVVYLLDVGDDGALGVIVNRPSTTPVGEPLRQWAGLAKDPAVLFHGGPVSQDSALAVAAIGGPVDGDRVMGWRRVSETVGVVDLDTPVELLGPALAEVRVFVGYAGWSADQLQAEVEEGSWYVLPSCPSDPFDRRPSQLRRTVLRRQPGERAWLSTRPLDPRVN